MGQIKKMLEALESGTYDDMTNDELYDLVLEKRYNVVFHNCLLLLTKIIHFEDCGDDRLQEKGLEWVRQQEEHDVEDLGLNVEKRCDEFLRSLRAAGVPFQVEKGRKGLFISASLDKSLLPLRPFKHLSELHYNLRLSFLNLVQILNGAYTCQGRDVYDIDMKELAQAFRRAAGSFEWALAQHVASTRRWVPQEELATTSQLQSLVINRSPQQTNYIARPGISPPRTVPAPSSVFPQSQPSTPSRRPTTATVSPYSRSAALSSPPAPPCFGVVSPARSQQAAISTWSSSARICKECKETGHSTSSCPKAKCYICKYPRAEDGSVMLLLYRAAIITGKVELTLCDF
jgi:hypothetical protein